MTDDERALWRKNKKIMRKKKTLVGLVLVTLLMALFPVIKSQAETLMNTTAYDFTVDGGKWFTVSDKTALDSLLSDYQKQYLKNVDGKANITNIAFKQNVEITPVRVSHLSQIWK